MKYKILEGIARADVAYQVFGKTIEELFENAAEAVEQTMADMITVRPLLNSEFRIQNSELDKLLLKYLEEIISWKDSRNLIFSKFKVKINLLDARRYTLDASLWGERIDQKKHKLKLDVKAVTRHKFSLKKTDKNYQAIIVLDI